VAARVPNIVGTSLDQAKTILKEVGLALADKISREVNDQPEGTIIRQNPKAGASKAPGNVVHVVVAARVPKIVGLKVEEAAAVLEKVGLALGEAKYRISDKPVETIFDQKPEAGSVATPGTKVQVSIAARVPDLVGQTPDQAKKVLAQYGLDFADEITQEVSDKPKGQIFRQQPVAGSTAVPGNVVSVVIAARVPDLFGRTIEQAKKIAATVGLTLSAKIGREVSDRPTETIIRQNPQAGATKAPGNQVSVVLAARVPAIIGFRLDKAKATIESVCLVLGKIQKRISAKAVNTVLEQKPGAGAVATPGSAVDVVVAARVPDLSGNTPAQAKKLLSAVGLELSEDIAKEVSDKPQGRIFRQSPKAGATQVPGNVVSVVVAARVPNIIGRTSAQAKKILSEVRLQLSDQIAYEVSRKTKDTIIQQTPVAGATKAPGNIVKVVLAARVPDVVGLDLEKARPILTAVGLVLGTVKEEVSQKPEGTILGQNPTAGSAADKGQKVNVVVAVKRMVQVPNIVGSHIDAAKARLEEMGLQIKVTDEQVSPRPKGTVLAQRPGAGTLVSSGTVVAVAVSRGRR
jgi:beta-lactam-binding protein with PASTA domain